MKERTMDALNFAEEYFVAVIEKEAGNTVVPSRTEELCYAAKGLNAIAITKYKQFLKHQMREGRTDSHILSR